MSESLTAVSEDSLATISDESKGLRERGSHGSGDERGNGGDGELHCGWKVKVT